MAATVAACSKCTARIVVRVCYLPSKCISWPVGTVSARSYATGGGQQTARKDLWSMGLIGVGIGAILGTGYAYNQHYRARHASPIANIAGGDSPYLMRQPPPQLQPSKKVTFPTDSSGLKLTLYQYQTCPFCCKVRTFLDYHGLSYDVIEVNPVIKQQIRWSPYKKVPILVAEDKDGQFLNLVDSTTIVSALASYLYNPENKLALYASYFPAVNYVNDEGLEKVDVLNRYFIMFGGEPAGRNKEDVAEERKWRRWADDVLVHTLSPNIYRNMKEALEAFHWFSETGEWEMHFASWERYLVIYVGATAMYFIGKRLKKRHSLKEDVRRSLYDACNQWVHELSKKGSPFMGGTSPNLADLDVFGVLSSIEGCSSFQDVLQHTKIGPWYNRTKEALGYGDNHHLPH